VFLSGRPLWVSPELNASTAFVAAWLPGTEGGGIADVLFRDSQGQVNFDFFGKLSYSWPRDPSKTDLNRGDPNYEPLFPYGFGLRYGAVDTLSGDPPEFHSSESTTELPATPALPLE
jgi:beta-glucosidase